MKGNSELRGCRDNHRQSRPRFGDRRSWMKLALFGNLYAASASEPLEVIERTKRILVAHLAASSLRYQQRKAAQPIRMFQRRYLPRENLRV